MIISASYRTDIPAFYGDWFMGRVQAGWCCAVNPYGGPPSRIALDRAHVDGVVFWTRNPEPFLPHLAELHARGYPFVIQFTITGYPGALEPRVVNTSHAVDCAWRIRERFGPHALVWRYDPVVFSSVTPPAFHRDTFGAVARQLRGAVDEVVISFAHVYRKTARNLDAAAHAHGFTWWDAAEVDKRALGAALVREADEHGMRLSICGQHTALAPGSVPAACVDAARLSRVAGRTIRARPRGHRPGCGCVESRDVGAYNSCPHGCAYCYAVDDPALAARRHAHHDGAGEFLCGPPSPATPGAHETLPLFSR